MSKTKVTETLMVLFTVILVPVLVRADQKKTTNPPPPPKPAPAAKPAQPAAKPAQPAAKPTQPAARPAQPTRAQPGNTGVRPAGGAVNNPNTRSGVVNPNARPGAANPSVRPGAANPNPRVGGANPPGGRPGTPTPTRTVATRGGGSLEVDRNNKPTHFVGKQGQEARFGSRGQIREVRDPKRGMTVERGLRSGDRRIVTERNGRRLVAMGPHRGYMERPYYRDRYGRAYVQRTYWVHGHPYAYAYRDHFYHGVHYYRYVPGYYYHPVFYGWAYNPWAAPVYYNWGWGPAPWFYGGYFAPAPYYPTASLWLTDYLLAENLKLAYSNVPGGTVVVPANQPWTATGINLDRGDEVTISAAGTIATNLNGATASPAGTPPDCSVAGPVRVPFVAPQLPCWSLLGRVGPSGGVFEVGSGISFKSATAGELFLGVNDNWFPDNSGNWMASIEVRQNQPAEGESPAATPMSPEVKQMIDAEVHRQLQAEQAAAQSPQAQPANDQAPPPALDPAQRLFVVSSNLGVSTAEGQECELTPGDVITRIDDTPGTDGKVKVSVMSGKPDDCSIGSSPRVEVSDLQEMHNSFREQLDSGLKTLAEKSGTGGLPKAPDTQTSAGEVPPPAPDRNVDTQLADQQKEATQAEAEVQQEVQTAQGPANQ